MKKYLLLLTILLPLALSAQTKKFEKTKEKANPASPADNPAKTLSAPDKSANNSTKPTPKGGFELSGTNEIDLTSAQLQENISDWFDNSTDKNTGHFEYLKPMEKGKEQYIGSCIHQFEASQTPNRKSSLTMNYKTEIIIGNGRYEYRFFDFKVTDVLSENGRQLSSAPVNLTKEPGILAKHKDPYRIWRLNRIENELQILADNLDATLQQVPQRLNTIE